MGNKNSTAGKLLVWAGERLQLGGLVMSKAGVLSSAPLQGTKLVMGPYPRRVMTRKAIDKELSRIAEQVIQDHADLERVVLIGIRRRGVPLASALQKKIEKRSNAKLPLGILDITFYRDDLSLVDSQPVVEGSHLAFDVTDQDVLLIDDVLYTGRTTRAALESVLDYGRPRQVRLVVLVDRGHRELPIHADYVGKRVETDEDEAVEVRVSSIDGEDGVFITTKDLLKED